MRQEHGESRKMTTKMQAEHGADREKCIRMHQEHGENRGMTILMKAELGEGQEKLKNNILGVKCSKMLASVNGASIYFIED